MHTTSAQPDVLDVHCGSRRTLERLADRLTDLGRSLAEPLAALCRRARAHLAEVDAHRARMEARDGR